MSYITLVNTLYISSPEEGSRSTAPCHSLRLAPTMSYITLVNTIYISSPEEGSRSGMSISMIGALDVTGVRHACDKSFICDSVHKNLHNIQYIGAT